MSNNDMTFQDLVNVLADIPTAATKQANGKYQVTTPSEGSASPHHDSAIRLALPNKNVEDGPGSSAGLPDLGPAQQNIYLASEAAPDVTKVLEYGKTSGPSNFDFKSASDQDISAKVEEQRKKASELENILRKIAANIPAPENRVNPAAATQVTQKAAEDNIEEYMGFQSKQAADEAALGVVMEFRKRASEIAEQFHWYNRGFADTVEYLNKVAANGELDQMMAAEAAGGLPPEAMGAEGGMPVDPAAMGAPPPDAGGGMPPEAMGGGGGVPAPDELVDQALAALMEVTGLPPQQLEALILDKLGQLGGGGEGLAQDSLPEGAEGSIEDAAGALGSGAAMKEAKSKELMIKLSNDVLLVRTLGKRAAELRGKNIPEPASKAAREHRDRAREYFNDLRRSVA